MGAARRLSSLLLSRSSPAASRGRNANWVREICRFSTAAAALEEPITPPVQIAYTQLLINGKFVDSASGKTFPTFDPRTGKVIAQVAEGDAEDINRAVSAARSAFDEGAWPKMTAYERSRVLLAFADLVEKHANELAALETWNNGKPFKQAAKSEIPMLARLFRYYAGWADKIHGLTAPADGPYHVQTLHEPIGVAGHIIPWNFPLLMFAWKVGPALACGNTIVLKSAEQTPLTALYAAKLLHEAGLPPGVLNIVSGYGPTAGAALASHMDVDKLAFTGSTDTGKVVLELAAKSNLKPVTLELGGKSPFIVCEDADIDKAVELAHFALFFNQGQCCCAGSRTYVHERVYDKFLEKAKARAMRRVVGDPFKKGVEQGPQIDSEQFEKVLRYIRSGIESSATLECGGDRLGSKGFYILPTVFSNVQDDMLIAKDEIFGPVQSILKFNDIDDVIRRANTTKYGLAAGVFTKNIDTAYTLSRALRVGTVWVNCFNVFDAAIPFGGYKMSGIGREKGIYSLHNYLQVKAVVSPLKRSEMLGLHRSRLLQKTGNFPLVSPHLVRHSHNLTTTLPPSPPSPEDDTFIANLVLNTDPKTLAQTLHDHPVQWTPDLVNKILKRLWNHGPKSLQFFNLLDRHPSYTHSTSSFDHAIDISARLHDYKTLWILVARMCSRHLGPTPKTFAIITERYVSAGKAERAVKIFLSMREHGCPPDLTSFNTFLDVLCKSRRVEMAYNLFKILRRRFQADTITYNILANGFCSIKRLPRALEISREMVENGLTPSLKTYNILLNGFFRMGQTKEAWEFFLEMKRRKCEIDVVSYTTLVHGFGVAGEVVRARKVFDEMIGAGVLPSVPTYNALIQVLCKKDNVENAIVVFEEMVSKGYVPNATTYNVVIRGLCHVGKMDKAMEYLSRMKDDECEPNAQTYNVIIRYYCDEGEIEKSLEVFERMSRGDCLPNLDTYNILVNSMFGRKRSDDLVLAGKLLIEMVDRGFLPRRFTFNRVLNGLLLTGNQEFAKEILRAQSRCGGRLPRYFRL